MVAGSNVLIMAGGTGGHVFPALAVARYLREKGIEVVWLGTRRGLEARIVPEAGFPIEFISISGLRGGTIVFDEIGEQQVVQAELRHRDLGLLLLTGEIALQGPVQKRQAGAPDKEQGYAGRRQEGREDDGQAFHAQRLS